jgi:tyrocidine synthetase-3
MATESKLDYKTLKANKNIKAKTYWTDRMTGFEFSNYFNMSTAASDGEYDEVSLDIPSDTYVQLCGLADSDKSKHIVLLSALGVLCHKYSAARNVAIVTPAYGFSRHGVEEDNNLLCVRMDEFAGFNFTQFVVRLKNDFVQDLQYVQYPIHSVLEKHIHVLGTQHQVGNCMAGLQQPAELDALSPGIIFTFSFGARPSLQIRYNVTGYERASVERIGRLFFSLLSRLIRERQMPLEKVSLLEEADQKLIFETLDQTTCPFPAHQTIHSLFEEQAALRPRAAAVIFEDQEITYGEVNQKANQIARYLIEKGVKQNDIVALFFERGAEMIITMLGVLKAGAAYLPIDPGYPADRIEYQLKDSQAALILTDLEGVEVSVDIPVANIRSFAVGLLDTSNLNRQIDPASPAYVMYTSGTTGRPKGVIIEHRNVVRLFFHENSLFTFSATDVWTMFHSYCFDFSVWEMYGALLFGGKLLVVKKIMTVEPGELAKTIIRHGVTILNQTPSAFYYLSEYVFKNEIRLGSLRYVVFAGEALKPIKLKSWRQEHPLVKLINMYGITEITVHATYREVTDEDIASNSANVGKPIPTLSMFVLNNDLQLLPPGVPGEIYVGGYGVGRGYLQKPELTAQRFIQSPFNAQERLYKSGDLAYLNDNLDFVYIGRIDKQVQLKGFRIELGEIENAMAGVEGLVNAVVQVKTSEKSDILVAYYTAIKDIDTDIIRDAIQCKLPSYMVPAYFVHIKEIPVTSNGKLDVKKLLLLDIEENKNYVAPQNDLQVTLTGIWQRILGDMQIGISDNFFTCGGDSIKAISMVYSINQALKSEISVADVLNNPTIDELSAFIVANPTAAGGHKYNAVLESIDKIKKRVFADVANPDDIEDVSMMSQIQKGMVFHYVTNFEDSLYHDQMVYFAKMPDFNPEVLRTTLGMMVRKHDMLRTSFNIDQWDEFIQIVHKEAPVDYEHSDISSLSRADQEDYITEFMKNDRKTRPFDYKRVPLSRMRTLHLGNDVICVIFIFHHAIIDGWSCASLMTEISNTYARLQKDPAYTARPLNSTYRDFVVRELYEIERDDSRQFWKNELADYKRLEFPPVTADEAPQSRFGKRIHTFPPEFVEILEKNARLLGISAKNLCFSAHVLSMSLFSPENDITIGLVTNNRPEIQDGDKILGCFLNTIPFRMTIHADDRYLDIARRVDAKLKLLSRYERFPFFEMVKLVGEDFYKSNPVFDTKFNYTHFHIYEAIENRNELLDEYKNKSYERTNTLCDFNLSRYGSEMSLELVYSSEIMTSQTADNILNYFIRALDKMVHSVTEAVNSLDIISDEDKVTLLKTWNNTDAVFPRDKTLLDFFRDTVRQHADAPAVLLGYEAMTYAVLDKRSDQLAAAIIRKGIQSQEVIAISVDRSFEMMVGIYAIFKAGCAYLPINPESPALRTEFMLRDCCVRLILTQRSNAGMFTGICDEIDMANFDYSGTVPVEVFPRGDAGDIAYIIYTSGTTGVPKGVAVEHRSVVSRITWIDKAYPMDQADVILQKTPFTFDVSVWELFWWTFKGARLAMLAPGAEKEPMAMIRTISDHQVSILNFVPSLLSAFVGVLETNEVLLENLKSLKYVLASGEALLPDQANRFNQLCYKHNKTRLINLYGPTETTVDVTYYDCFTLERLEHMPIGKPIDNVRMYVVNKNNWVLPRGIKGELCIGGTGLARGYVNRVSLTSEKFLALPGLGHERVYKTGDFVRWQSDGNIEFLGRMDNQVKIRGNRVELQEIESELIKHDSITDVAVLIKEKNDDKQLVAYYVADTEIEHEALRNFLLARLPEYMTPDHFVMLSQMPITSNGKLDRKALPDPELKTTGSYRAPANEIEEKLTGIWSEILGIDAEKISVSADFFQLGGHSLKAMTLANKIQKNLGVDVPIKEIFKRRNILNLGSLVQASKTSRRMPIRKASPKAYYPLSIAQKRLHFLYEFDRSSLAFNVPQIIKITGVLEKQHIDHVFKSLIDRHESLRTSFKVVNDEPVQIVSESVDFSVEHIQCLASEVTANVKNFVRPFDLSDAPLIRARLLDIAPEEHILMVDIHHIVMDGTSIGLMIKDFMALYNHVALPPLELDYKDYSEWQQSPAYQAVLGGQREFWLREFAEPITPLSLPTDFGNAVMKKNEGGVIKFTIDGETTGKLKAMADREEATLSMVMLSAFNILLSKLSGQEDIVVGSPMAGREYMELERVIGMFAVVLPLRNYPKATLTFKEFLSSLKNRFLAALDHHAYPYEDLALELQMERTTSRNPWFDVMFLYQNFEVSDLAMPGLAIEPYHGKIVPTQQSLDLMAFEKGGQILFKLTYASDLFEEKTVERFIGYYRQILTTILENPSIRLGAIEMIDEQEKISIRKQFNNTARALDRNKTVYELFAEQVKKTPDIIAVEHNDLSLSYQALQDAAGMLSARLALAGTEGERTVTLYMPRSLDMLVSILATFQAGKAYIPLDVDYPVQRIEEILADSESPIVITTKAYLPVIDGLRASLPALRKVICIDETDVGEYGVLERNITRSTDDLAYIIYTSGTTGKPKGVMIHQLGMINHLYAKINELQLDNNDVVAQTASPSFDISVWQFLAALVVGGRTCIVDKEDVLDPERLSMLLKEKAVTVCESVPSLVLTFLDALPQGMEQLLVSLRWMLVTGEALDTLLVSKWYDRFPGIRLLNAYGPTEASDDVTHFVLHADRPEFIVPIGKPIQNTHIYIVDQSMNLCPLGVKGQIAVAGLGVGKGYWKDEAKTRKAFVLNPFNIEKGDMDFRVLYLTGDEGYYSPEGYIVCLGRTDEQIKIRGNRIELGEIESRLRSYAGVQSALVLVKEGQGKYLVAYYVAETAIESALLEDYLSHRLPAYMIPAAFVHLREMPLTINGKINRKALPDPEVRIGSVYVAPSTELEYTLMKIWADVLNFEPARIGVHTNFFSLGGHSLNAVIMTNRVYQECNVKIALKEFFARPTIAYLAERVGAHEWLNKGAQTNSVNKTEVLL